MVMVCVLVGLWVRYGHGDWVGLGIRLGYGMVMQCSFRLLLPWRCF
jgi:hypothetical protein